MKVADLALDPRIPASPRSSKELAIEDLYPPQERAAPIALDGKSLVAYLDGGAPPHPERLEAVYNMPLRSLRKQPRANT